MSIKNIYINISNKYCSVEGTPVIVCGNSDYTITFNFDADWSQVTEKTARFSYVRDGARLNRDVKLTGNTVEVPALYNTRYVQVGVYAGDLVTSTPARIPCEKSIACGFSTPDGFDLGRQAERQEFWNNIPSAYNAKYKFAGPAWNSYTFYPTKDLTFKAIPIDYAFMQHAVEGPAYDLAQRLEECGVTLDFSKVTRATEAFNGARFTRLPELNFGSVTSMNRAFQDMSELVTIDKLIVSDTTFNDTFSGCTALKNIIIEGTIGNNINFSDSPLSRASIDSIIEHLKDFSGTSTTRTITFGEKNEDEVTTTHISIANGKGWTLVC